MGLWDGFSSLFGGSSDASSAGTVSGVNSDLLTKLGSLSSSQQSTVLNNLTDLTKTGTSTNALSSLGSKSSGLDTTLGMNIGTGQLALSGLSTLSNLYTAWNAVDLANKNYNLTKATSQANLDNTVKTYNNTLEDKITSRYNTEGRSSADASSYISSHKLNSVTL